MRVLSVTTDKAANSICPCHATPLSIGPLVVDPPVLAAPMAGFTDYAFRQMVREYGGVGLLTTEMVSARALVWTDRRRAAHPGRLWGVKEEPGPLAVQIWDNDPGLLAEAGARLAQEYRVSLVDINFGCPVARVSERTRSGSYLLRDPERVGVIVERVATACRPTPVTAKIRLGPTRDQINAVEVAVAVETAGAAALTVHGRTADARFRGRADWDRISRIKGHLRRIPLVGNGDIDSPQTATRAMKRYGVDGVMIGRAALGRPWLFAQVRAALRGDPVPPDPTAPEQRACLLRHYDRMVGQFGEAKGTILMRAHACCYGRGCRCAKRFRRQIAVVTTAAEFREVARRCFGNE